MYAISRYLQTVASKKRKRHQQIRELKRLRGEAEEIQAPDPTARDAPARAALPAAARASEESRWWRMRPRLPKPRRAGH